METATVEDESTWVSIPKHTKGMRMAAGCTFVFLTQKAIDCFIPPHNNCCHNHEDDNCLINKCCDRDEG